MASPEPLAIKSETSTTPVSGAPVSGAPVSGAPVTEAPVAGGSDTTSTQSSKTNPDPADLPLLKRAYLTIRVWIFGSIGAFVLFCLNRTVRWEVHMFGGRKFEEWEVPEPVILSFWHQRELMIAFLYLDYFRKRIQKPMFTMISKHNDGRIIACAMRWLKIHSVAGSSNRDGKKALHELIDKVNEGYGAGMMPDGPRGPIFKAKYGIVKLAQQTGRPLVPVAYSTDRKWQFKSWDKMMLPKPFSKGVYYIGEPLWIPQDTADDELEGYLHEIEHRMTDALENSDRLIALAKSSQKQ